MVRTENSLRNLEYSSDDFLMQHINKKFVSGFFHYSVEGYIIITSEIESF